MNQDIFLAILTDMDEAFYSSNLAQYRDKRAELICHVCSEEPRKPEGLIAHNFNVVRN
jgi:hypothetical protein